MKILLCHNRYQYAGGEDHSFDAECRLLESRGHTVLRLELDNADIAHRSRWDVVRCTLWNQQTYRTIREIIRRERPGVMHCTNIFPLISPSAYYAARREGVAVVQSLRNYRLLCPNALFLRNSQICEDCVGKCFSWPGILHGCYRGSRSATAVVAGMLTLHRNLGTWRRAVDQYFTPSEFARAKYVEAGFPADRISVKPNFIHPDPGPGRGQGGYAVFVGRLSAEKGVDTLLDAWRKIGPRLPLKIVGDGPLVDEVRARVADQPEIEYMGQLPHRDVVELIGKAVCLVMPSRWYETFGRTIIEAYAKGTPAIVARLGSMAELVEEGRTGLLFEPDDPGGLADRVRWILDHPAETVAMRRAARSLFEERYRADSNYTMLMEIYQLALDRRAQSPTLRNRRMRESQLSPRDLVIPDTRNLPVVGTADGIIGQDRVEKETSAC